MYRITQLAANVHSKYEPLLRSVCGSPSAGKFAMSEEMPKQPKPNACSVQKLGNFGVLEVFNSATKSRTSPQKNLGLPIGRYASCASNAIIRECIGSHFRL
jgi:hypothetical protein